MSEWTFIDHATDYLMRDKLGDNKEPNGYPSEATAVYNKDGVEVVVGKCRRATFFRQVKDWVDFDPEAWGHLKPLANRLELEGIPLDRYTQWIFEAGNMYEDFLINVSKNSGVYIADQVPVFIPSPRVSGRIDILVINPHTGKISIVEVKSIYGHNVRGVIGQKLKDGTVFGVPRDSHLLQIALYQWRFGMPRDFEDARLVYGARDTGQYAEFRVRINQDLAIEYRQVLPYRSEWITTPITIGSIVNDGYDYVERHLETGTIPPRDFDLQYDDARLRTLYREGQLSKVDTEKFEKLEVINLRQRVDAGETLDTAEQELYDKYDGKRIKKDQKTLEKGDWQCRFCKWRNLCYDSDGNERTI